MLEHQIAMGGALAYLETRPPCDCGHCLDCTLRKQIDDESEPNTVGEPTTFQNHQEGNSQMSTQNQQIAENFTHGSKYLNEWQRSAEIRQEFDNDFEAFCHYQAAYSKGLVKMQGVK